MSRPTGLGQESYATTLHEIRVPLSSINGYASLLLTGELGKLPPRQREPVQRIQELCGSLTALIGNLLTLAKGGSSLTRNTPGYVDLRQVARQAAQSVQGDIRRKKLYLSSHLPAGPVLLWGQASNFSQILLNLLSNAVKFTPPGGKLSVEISRRPQAVTLRVSDTGVGIPPQELPKIFRQFYHRDHPEVGAAPGSGLGLTIVKRMVDNYGGRIAVKSRVGRGTEFRVTLPVRSNRQIVEEHLAEAWRREKEPHRATGVLLLQVRSKSPRSARFIGFLGQALKGLLRREDRIFTLPGQLVLAVLHHVKMERFAGLVRRLEQSLQAACARRRPPGVGLLPWRLIGVMGRQQDRTPAGLMHRVRKEMSR